MKKNSTNLRARKARGSSRLLTRPPEQLHASRPDALSLLQKVTEECQRQNSVAQLLQLLVESAATLTVASCSAAALYSGKELTLRLTAFSRLITVPEAQFASAQEMDDWVAHQFDNHPGKPTKRTARERKNKRRVYTLEAPLAAQGTPIGRLGVYAERRFTEQDQHWLQVLAGQLGLAIYGAQLRERAEQAHQQLEREVAIETAVGKIGTLPTHRIAKERLAEELLTILHSVVPFDSAAVYQPQRADRFVPLAANREGRALGSGTLEPLNFETMPLLHELLMVRKPLYLEDVSRELRWRPHLPQHLKGSWAGIPLVSGGSIIGLLCLGSHDNRFLSPSHRQTVELIATQFATVMLNLILVQQNRDETARLSALSRQVITAQEEERKRVSRELHDEAGQSLTALGINLELLHHDLSGQSQSLIDRARESVAITKQTLKSIRSLARQLRPPALDTLGLSGALEQLSRDVERSTKLKVSISAQEIGKVDDLTSLTLYRFVQEALTNVNKHAKASHAEVCVEKLETGIQVSVKDDGKGFDSSEELKKPRRAGRLGLVGMRERLALVSGRLEIQSTPGGGTVLTAYVPFPEK